MNPEIAKKLRFVGGAMIGLALIIWIVTIPQKFPNKEAKARWEAYQAQEAKIKANPPAGIVLRQHLGIGGSGDPFYKSKLAAHKQCFWTSGGCPVGGNLYLLMWFGLAAVGASLIFTNTPVVPNKKTDSEK